MGSGDRVRFQHHIAEFEALTFVSVFWMLDGFLQELQRKELESLLESPTHEKQKEALVLECGVDMIWIFAGGTSTSKTCPQPKR
jgi:hypothetical protein